MFRTVDTFKNEFHYFCLCCSIEVNIVQLYRKWYCVYSRQVKAMSIHFSMDETRKVRLKVYIREWFDFRFNTVPNKRA